ncbi:MAG: pyridoxamine 5'-phosphate oxidase family protein [Gemmatimonadaceae bacterium]
MITRADLLAFLRGHRYAVQSSVHPEGGPQSAVVGIAVSDDFEIIFDTLENSRKAQSLRERPEIAFVFADLTGKDERTVQCEGVVDESGAADLDRLIDLYIEVFPAGRERQKWPGLIYVTTTPTWLRYCDYNQDPPAIIEFDGKGLSDLK